MNLKAILQERLIRYAKIDTQSNEQCDTTPTTEGQLELARMLVQELTDIGLEDVTMDENGYVMATLPATSEKDLPTIGFLAHLDTATDFTGKNVNPLVWQNYDGNELILNQALDVIMSPKEYPELTNYKGHTLITTDGTTLLGADNKAGIAEIMTAMEYLHKHPEIEHGKIRVAFTPDEEIGRGPHKFNVEKFNAAFAYTVDGGPLGELQYESFNAAAAKIVFKGNNVHPGTAKGKMVHSTKIANEFMNMLPTKEAPEYTEGYEGFFHLISVEGSVEETELYYIIRDFDKEKFQTRKSLIHNIVKELQQKHGKDSIELQIKDQYFNMREKIEPVMEIVDVAKEAMKSLHIEPIIEPIRGGTDGSQLSFMGLPTPNIFTGGENFHGKYEFISVDNMEKAVQVILEICKRFGESK
ncbi:peptidase T [Pseudogracilibacillus sp. SE30717A]|uniref:peptidase T n=1 Tax=Pseudogracilibacillus sp. SE30717A TaxID=3098293 RepID=UPI00300DC907